MNSKGCCLTIDQHFKRILNLMPDAVYISSRQGDTIFVNSKWEDLTGISALDVLGKNVRDLIKEGVFNHIVNPDVVATAKPVMHVQEVNGRNVVIDGNPIFDKNNQVELVVTFVRDVTTSRQSEVLPPSGSQ